MESQLNKYLEAQEIYIESSIIELVAKVREVAKELGKTPKEIMQMIDPKLTNSKQNAFSGKSK